MVIRLPRRYFFFALAIDDLELGFFFSLVCSCVKGSNNVTLIAVEVTYDPKSPKFGASTREAVSGLWIDWALEETRLCKDDR